MKKGLKGLLVLFIVALVALVIALNINQAQDGVRNVLTGNGGGQNLSNAKGDVQLNVTLTGNATGEGGQQFSFNWTNVTFMFSNTSDLYMYNVTVRNSTQNDTYFNTTLNTALLADNVYNLSINYTNITSDSGQNISAVSLSGWNITIDTTAPSVTMNTSTSLAGLPAVNGSNITASKGNVSLNFTIGDFKPASATSWAVNLFNISVITLVLNNGTGADVNFSSLGGSGIKGNITNVSGVWYVNYNLSSLFEGMQGGVLTVNDTHNNTRVVIFNFTVDRTAPVMLSVASSDVSTTSAKVKATLNETVSNCTYTSVAGAQGSVVAGNLSADVAGVLTAYSKTFSGLAAGTGYQIEITCTDFAGYSVTNSFSWATSAATVASTGGSGSGGSSNGVSTSVQGSFEKKVWTSIKAGETASVALKNGVMGVTEVSFSVPATVYGAWVNVAKKETLPSSVSSFSGKVYRNLEISKGPALNKEGAFTDATVKFKVEKAWLAQKQLTKEAVALHHYDGGKWVELSTSVGEDDGTYVHYSAKTPSFSYFVIGEKSGAQAAPAVEQPVVEAPAEQPAVEAPAEQPVVEKKGMSTGLLVALLAAVVVVVAAVVYMRKRR